MESIALFARMLRPRAIQRSLRQNPLSLKNTGLLQKAEKAGINARLFSEDSFAASIN